MQATFGVKRKPGQARSTHGDPKKLDRVSSFCFSDQELKRSTTEAVCVVLGSASLSRSQPGDLARSFFGQVIR